MIKEYIEKGISKGWNATGDEYFYAEGSTPSEAVARLWLELNK